MIRDPQPRSGVALSADAALLGATVIWGGSFVLVSAVLAEASPLFFVALRFSIAAALLAPFAARRSGAFAKASLRAGCEVGFLLVLGFALQTVGMRTTEPARAAFLTGLTVVLVPVLQVVLVRRIPTAGSLVGVALATLGLYAMTNPRGGGLSQDDGAVLLGAAAFALYMLAVDRHARGIDPLVLLFWQIASGAAFAFPITLAFETPRPPSSAFAWSGLLFAAVFGTALCLAAQIWAQRRMSPTRAAVILTAEPVFAAAFSYVLVGERLDAWGIAGAFLIVSGMLAAELLP